VGPDVFRSHLVTLRERGYTTITLAQLAEALNRGTPLPPNPIVLTFDDGYRDNYENAFPILQEEGAVGTFFLITDLLEQNHPLYMTWDQAREMAAGGMEMTSHTTAHAALSELGAEEVWVQVSRSRQLLQERLGVDAATFSYPYGKVNGTAAALVTDAGYGAAVTTEGDVRHNSGERMRLARVRVHGGDFPESLMAQISYWLDR
jgi:peptidoglycan/xylan/chitin deacetylase (PgdA/CDA1 family)